MGNARTHVKFGEFSELVLPVLPGTPNSKQFIDLINLAERKFILHDPRPFQ